MNDRTSRARHYAIYSRAFLPGIIKVHDLHIWAMSTTETALTAHLLPDGTVDPHNITADARQQIKVRFGIGHSTLQWEQWSAAFSRR